MLKIWNSNSIKRRQIYSFLLTIMKLTRFQMAAVKRTAQNTKKLVSTREKIQAKLNELAGQMVEINKQIDAWEEPIKVMTGGYTSEQMILWDGVIPEDSMEEIPTPTIEDMPDFGSADYVESTNAQLN